MSPVSAIPPFVACLISGVLFPEICDKISKWFRGPPELFRQHRGTKHWPKKPNEFRRAVPRQVGGADTFAAWFVGLESPSIGRRDRHDRPTAGS
jgi:hypothetical protein